MKTISAISLTFVILLTNLPFGQADQTNPPAYDQAIFDDKLMLNGYADKFKSEPKEILLAMIQDDTLNPLKMAAAVRIFKDNFSREIFTREKLEAEKILWRRLNRTESPFVQVEIMHTLCRMDRYKYFDAMAPAISLKLDHYNAYITEMAYNAINDIIQTGNNRTREARIIFNTLRRMLFLSRKRLASVTQPNESLSQKLKILRWSIKVLGNQELKKLPPEVIRLL